MKTNTILIVVNILMVSACSGTDVGNPIFKYLEPVPKPPSPNTSFLGSLGETVAEKLSGCFSEPEKKDYYQNAFRNIPHVEVVGLAEFSFSSIGNAETAELGHQISPEISSAEQCLASVNTLSCSDANVIAAHDGAIESVLNDSLGQLGVCSLVSWNLSSGNDNTWAGYTDGALMVKTDGSLIKNTSNKMAFVGAVPGDSSIRESIAFFDFDVRQIPKTADVKSIKLILQVEKTSADPSRSVPRPMAFDVVLLRDRAALRSGRKVLDNIDLSIIFGGRDLYDSNKQIELELNEAALNKFRAVLPFNANQRVFSIAIVRSKDADPQAFASLQTYNNAHPPILRVSWKPNNSLFLGDDGVVQTDLKK